MGIFFLKSFLTTHNKKKLEICHFFPFLNIMSTVSFACSSVIVFTNKYKQHDSKCEFERMRLADSVSCWCVEMSCGEGYRV